MSTDVVAGLLVVLGCLAISVGAFMASMILGFIVSGVLTAVIGALMAAGNERP